MRSVSELKIKLFADGADKAQILQAHANPLIRGFTTNPTLMRAAGVKDYEIFAHEILEVVTDRPISFEVFADEFCEMERQAHKIAGWGENVNVKIPVTNTRRESSMELVRRLSHSGVKVNVTAILTLDQIRDAATPAPVLALAVLGMNDVLNSQGYTQFAWWNRIPVSAWILLAVIAISEPETPCKLQELGRQCWQNAIP